MSGNTHRSIDLRTVTTSITFGRPFEIPFEQKIFAFEPDKWRRLFPGYVVDFRIEKANAIPDAETLRRDGKLPLPNDDLPVIVAAWMSLSFPVLFTLVNFIASNTNFQQSAVTLQPARSRGRHRVVEADLAAPTR
ncbi:hypothetical protein [Lentisalinibacter salinarum]|uniref:hypothetical protein n=1 Tax=Lentisalinibacter salinarum TaxID=2992239 RepID=UPI00386B6734